MSIYDDRPWLARYASGQPAEIAVEYANAVAMFRATLKRNPGGDAIRYFDGRITVRELDRLTDAFAAGLAGTGFAKGDRVALYLQNVPQFVIAQLGTWKAGGIAVSINPMNRERELELLLKDSRRPRAGQPAGPVPGRRFQGRGEHRSADGHHDLGAGVPDPGRHAPVLRNRAHFLRRHR